MDFKDFRDFRGYLGFSRDFWDFGIFGDFSDFLGLWEFLGYQMENHPKGKSFSFICQTGSGFFGFLLGILWAFRIFFGFLEFSWEI